MRVRRGRGVRRSTELEEGNATCLHPTRQNPSWRHASTRCSKLAALELDPELGGDRNPGGCSQNAPCRVGQERRRSTPSHHETCDSRWRFSAKASRALSSVRPRLNESHPWRFPAGLLSTHLREENDSEESERARERVRG